MHEFGGREQLVVEDVPDPEPGPGEVTIRVDVCALNHVDVDIREGISRFEISLPHILGLEVVGRVERLGEGAEGFQIGERVMPYLLGGDRFIGVSGYPPNIFRYVHHRADLVLFATPVYCQSQFCGPSTDALEQIAKTGPKTADYIHVEIYANYDKHQINRAAAAWLLRKGNLTEPWLFLIAYWLWALAVAGAVYAAWNGGALEAAAELRTGEPAPDSPAWWLPDPVLRAAPAGTLFDGDPGR